MNKLILNSVITKIEFQKKNKSRVNIYMDDEYAFACDAELVYIHNITKGRVMDKESLENIANEDNYIKGKTVALHFLERSYKSSKQVIDKLAMKEFDEKTIDRVVKFLNEYDFINDKKFVEMYIKEKVNSAGKNKIKFALLKKSLPKELIIQGLSTITNEEQLQVAIKLGRKKFVTLSKSEKDYRKLYKKLSDYLQRSGYDFDIIKQVLNEITDNDNDEKMSQVSSLVDTSEEDYQRMYALASRRYNILIKSEKQKVKMYKKLGDYLLRRGFKWDQIKKALRELVNGEEDSYDGDVTNESRW
ncbi:MAG: recombination regulator RecX [Clostridium sp.]|uniref:recombination regulator RecX n=1 Tax=Clostridium sp. TaxID=1506 RepID=UPI003D6CC19A